MPRKRNTKRFETKKCRSAFVSIKKRKKGEKKDMEPPKSGRGGRDGKTPPFWGYS